MISALLIVLALLAGTVIGARCTRRALRTTHGRQRHGCHRPPTATGPAVDTGLTVVLDNPTGPTPMEEMEAALRTAALHTGALHTDVVIPHPQTVALRRIDGTLPARLPAPQIAGAVGRGIVDAAAARTPHRFPHAGARG